MARPSPRPRPLSPLWWGVVLPLIALGTLVALGLLVAAYPALPAWDAAFLLRLHRYATPEINRGVAVATDLGTVWGVMPATLGLIALALWRRRWTVAGYWIGTMLGITVLNIQTKLLWQRLRPSLWEGIPLHPDFSFPSGHATYSMAFVLALVLLQWDRPGRPWLMALGGLFVVFIGLSRVYLGVHYPSDIVGGWLLAIVWVVSFHQMVFRWAPLSRVWLQKL
jgi:membrane-associated phospholipid phosphatase